MGRFLIIWREFWIFVFYIWAFFLFKTGSQGFAFCLSNVLFLVVYIQFPESVMHLAVGLGLRDSLKSNWDASVPVKEWFPWRLCRCSACQCWRERGWSGLVSFCAVHGEELPLTLLIRPFLGRLCTIACLSRIGCIRPRHSNLQLCVYSVLADGFRSSDVPAESLLL